MVSTPLKNIMGRIIPYTMENKKCVKPPISVYIYISTRDVLPYEIFYIRCDMWDSPNAINLQVWRVFLAPRNLAI